jgi:hypothetical protein
MNEDDAIFPKSLVSSFNGAEVDSPSLLISIYYELTTPEEW